MIGGVASESSAELWFSFVVVALVGLAPVVFLVASLRETSHPRQAHHRSLFDILQERYARGEISAEEYEQLFIELLNDCYARGMLRLNEYQAHLDQIWAQTRGEDIPGAQSEGRAGPQRAYAEGATEEATACEASSPARARADRGESATRNEG